MIEPTTQRPLATVHNTKKAVTVTIDYIPSKFRCRANKEPKNIVACRCERSNTPPIEDRRNCAKRRRLMASR